MNLKSNYTRFLVATDALYVIINDNLRAQGPDAGLEATYQCNPAGEWVIVASTGPLSSALFCPNCPPTVGDGNECDNLFVGDYCFVHEEVRWVSALTTIEVSIFK